MTQYILDNGGSGAVVPAPNTDPSGQIWSRRTGDVLCNATAMMDVVDRNGTVTRVFAVDGREMIASGGYTQVA